jgi:hypothetical protein
VDSGLHEQIFDSSDLMSHATPEILAENLPPDLVAKVLQSALAAGSMTTDSILNTLTPEIIAKYLPHIVLWECVSSSAKRSGITDAKTDVQNGDKRRTFLRRVLDCGLTAKVLTPDDVLRHTTPDVLAKHLPNDLKAKLLTEGLRANKLNPQLIVDTLGVDALAGHMPMSVVWACLSEAGERSLAGDGNVVGAVKAVTTDDKKGAKPSNGGRRNNVQASKSKKPARAAIAAGTGKDRPIAPAPFDDDTNVNDWAGAEDFEVVEEEELVAMTDDVLGAVGTDWPHDDETNVGNETTRRK